MSRKQLSDPEKFALWAKSGGICAIRECNEKLLFQIEDINVNVSNAAHIISHSDDGPRGEYKSEYGITSFNVDGEPNLMLTCLKHHKIIDDDKAQKLYPPELLYQMKKEHEEWVERQLNLKIKSIALLHKTKGGPIDEILLSGELNSLLVATIQYQEEFLDFSPDGWQQGKIKNEELFKQFRATTKSYPGTNIEMFPLSHIPLLIHAGYLITDTTPVTVYQYERSNMVWIHSAPINEEIDDLGLSQYIQVVNSKKLVVAIGLSGRIYIEDINAVVKETSYDLLQITIDDPRPDRVLFQEHVKQIRDIFRVNVQRLHTEHQYDQLHLFYAGPAGLAVEIGRCINPSMWPVVYLYHYENRNNPKYQLAFTI